MQYDGPVFVTDIDETLRDNTTKPRSVIPGALDILWKVANMRVPIVYLTAAPMSGAREFNVKFLSPFPVGILLDRQPADQRPNGEYKKEMLEQIAKRYPNATLICMGDNATHDVPAYQVCVGGSFIREVTDWRRDNGPPERTGMRVYRAYTDETKRQIYSVLEELQKVTGRHPPRQLTLGIHEVVVGGAA